MTENKRSSVVRSTISRRKRKNLGAIGLVVFVLALVGVIFIGKMSIDLTSHILDNTKEKERLENFILPVIMFDPLTFDLSDPEQPADPRMLLESSIWSTLLTNGSDKFAKDDYGLIILPATDVDVQAAKLFGSEVKLQHQTIADYEISYQYDEEQNAYYIPVTATMAVYTPKILEITHKGDLYTLQVGYIPQGNLWQMTASGENAEPTPDKIMLMELKKVKGGYNIVALKDGPDTQALNSNPNQVTPQTSVNPEEEMLPPDETLSSEASGEELSSSEAEETSSSEAETPPVFSKVTASSTAAASNGHSYEVSNAMDNDWETAWIEGKDDDGIGEYLLFEADTPQTLKGIRLTNGFTSDKYYTANNRITQVTIEFSNGTKVTEKLEGYDKLFEEGEFGEITFDAPVETTSVKIIIDEIERGSRYKDSCISEVQFF